MKKVFLFLVIAAVAGLTSCKKNWACECGSGSSFYSETEGYNGLTKKQAKQKCEGDVSIGLIKVDGDNDCIAKPR